MRNQNRKWNYLKNYWAQKARLVAFRQALARAGN